MSNLADTSVWHPMLRSVGAVLRRERATIRKWTLRKMSHESGLSLSYISQIERGQALPAVHRLQEMAQCLGMSMAKLFELAEAHHERIRMEKENGSQAGP
jgi:transcriptional regulator with XRE-family HTH domain